MYKVSKFECAKAPEVKQVLSIEEVLQIIKNGDDYLQIINTARLYGKGSALYDNLKTNSLPTFRFNFHFKGSAKNQNITSSTGLIYLDVDGSDYIPQSDYIFASWKSLSNKGYGILVKVDNLTIINYSDVYNQLSEILGICSDAGARKATQQTVLSYDSDLYHNPNSTVFHFTEIKKVSNTPILEKREGCIGTDETFIGFNTDAIRFNNIGDYFTGEYENMEYRVFDEKIMICSPFIPRITKEGNRNSRMFYLLSQYGLLNPKAGKGFLKAIASTINKRMLPSLSENEIDSICDSIVRMREERTLTMYFNEERRLLFNPNIQIPVNEKMKIVNTVLGQMKSKLTEATIYIALENWDFDAYGKITQTKVAELLGKSISTIKRYWNAFKSYAIDLNNDYKAKITIVSEVEIIPKIEEKAVRNDGITTEKYIRNLKRKYKAFDDYDERYLLGQFKKYDIKNSLDNGFMEIHKIMTDSLSGKAG